MHTTPVIPINETTPKFSVEAARLLLEQALEAENNETDAANGVEHKRAANASIQVLQECRPLQNKDLEAERNVEG